MRLAIIGAGVIGARHIAAIEAVQGAHLVAVVDVNQSARQFAGQASAPFFSSAQAMLAAVQPDGIIVCTPTIHHYDPVMLALEAGCHVLVEKPIAANPKQALDIVEKSAQKKLGVLVGHQRRQYQFVQRARELVQGGSLGQLLGVTGQWAVRKDDAYFKAEWRQQRAAGPVLTNLIHEIDLLRFICGEIESVMAETSNLVRSLDKEDVAACVLRFASGALGTFLITDQGASPWAWELATGENAALPRTGENPMRFIGTDAALEFPNLVLWQSGTELANWQQPLARAAIDSLFEDAYIKQIEHFIQVIAGQARPVVDAADGLRSLAATLAIFESAQTGRRVTL